MSNRYIKELEKEVRNKVYNLFKYEGRRVTSIELDWLDVSTPYQRDFIINSLTFNTKE